METYNDKEKSILNIERMVLAIFSVYALNICYLGYKGGWEAWTYAIILFGLVVSWVAHVARYKNFGTRALVTTMAISLTILLYGVNVDDFSKILPTLFVLTGLVGLYGVLELVWVVGIFLMFIVIRQCALLWGQEVNIAVHANLLLQIWNVAFYVIIIIIWVRGRVQNIKQKQTIIEERIAAEKARDDFVTNVSHEIRTPLNIIYGNSEVVQGEEDIAKVHEHVNNIAVASRRLIGMVSDILDYSELAYGEVTLEEEVYDITSTVNDVVSMTMAQLEGKKLEVMVDIDIKMPKLLLGDEKKIRRIVMNLVSNAIKFTNSGYILISVGARKESYGVNLCISVQDSGIGMSEEDVEKLFTMYNQADTKRNRRGDGIGLGISISNLLARKLGGVLSVRSKKGEGSIFTFVVPQRVVNDIPVVSVENLASYSVAYCLDMESDDLIKVRDVYSKIIDRMINQFDVSAQFYRNLDDLKHRGGRFNYTHVFISLRQYVEDPQYFDAMAERCIVVVIMENILTDITMSPKIVQISKPFYSLQVAMVFATTERKKINNVLHHELKFRAPDAKILVVDDNQMNINVVRNLLKKYEIKVEQALSGAEALEKIVSMEYDFIFMDHMMPEMDGVETTHRIRQKIGSYYQKVPIVALTANAIAGSREMFLSEGFNDFLEKPVEPSVLERVLRRNIPVSKQIPIENADDGLGRSDENHKPEEKDGIFNASEPVKREGLDGQTSNIGETSDKKQEDEEMGKEETQGSKPSVWEKIDRESGILYCGGEEGYSMIVAECVHSYAEMAQELEDALAKQDYPMYVIKIHAIKSTMKSIGAMDLSEKARQLEFAGKEGRLEEIHEKHAGVAFEYYSLMKELYEEEEIRSQLEPDFDFEQEAVQLLKIFEQREGTEQEKVEGPEVDSVTQPEIDEETLKKYQAEFESAMYALDEESMTSIVEQLEQLSVTGGELSALVKKMRYKIERNDYFSAGDLLLAFVPKEKGE